MLYLRARSVNFFVKTTGDLLENIPHTTSFCQHRFFFTLIKENMTGIRPYMYNVMDFLVVFFFMVNDLECFVRKTERKKNQKHFFILINLYFMFEGKDQMYMFCDVSHKCMYFFFFNYINLRVIYHSVELHKLL